MRETRAIIERVRRVSNTLQQIELSVDSALSQYQPGQSIMAAPLDHYGWEPYLREHWIPVSMDGNQMVVELPVERVHAPGQVASLISPVGSPIPLRDRLHNLLLIAEDAMPTPLVWLARHVIKVGGAVTLVLAGQAIRYPLELLPPAVEIVLGETDWTWPEQVETTGWADQIVALAPSGTQLSVYGTLYDTLTQLRHHDVPDDFVFGLFYQAFTCGVGACHSCQITGRKKSLLACTDGPAIDLKKVRF
ncbi:MAG: hypothetical protein GYB65_18410 [Chloroflexi bacterium]|nr:hypothetical protein [Chloroflexota bacterium]